MKDVVWYIDVNMLRIYEEINNEKEDPTPVS